ncbi:MAG: outer membrane beta-barrel protein [Mucilaginibacter sp.]|uniref:outer membrane beta-barrel protein n=1 Tax=Mucilaginibacter sp. TaxID=1882438 RepID=UPI0031AC83BA
MKKLYALLLAATLFPFVLKAQSNYKPGYAVTVKGDTLRGFIDLREWQTDPRNINFKTSASASEIQILGPSAITFFNVSDLVSYERYIGKLSTDRTNTSVMINGRDTSTITDSLFLRVLQKGSKVTLYEYNDKIKTHFFVADNADNKPAELIYRIYYDGAKTVTENGYMRQLYALAVKYGVGDNLHFQINKADYNLLDIEKITAKINNIDKKDIEKQHTLNKGTTFYVGAGLNIGTIKAENVFSPSSFIKSTTLFPRVNVGLNVYANPNVGKFIFRLEAAFTGNKFKTTESYYAPALTHTVDQYNFSLIPQVIYNFYNADNFKFYGGAGFSINISSYKGSNLTVTDPTTGLKNTFKPATMWGAFPIKTGIVLQKKIDLYAAYIPTAYFTDDSSYSMGVTSIQIGINYAF